jgi:hypothetical protein
VLYSCFTSTYSCIRLLSSYFTRTGLGVCVCVCLHTGLVECVQQRAGLRREGAWEHGTLQQTAAGEAPLHEPPHACLLMHVGAEQARTRGRQERPVRALVSRAEQVREMHVLDCVV